MVTHDPCRRSRLARIGLALVIVLGVLAVVPASPEVSAEAPPAYLLEPLPVSPPEEVVLRVDVPAVGEKGGSSVRVGVEASFAEGSGVLSEDVAVSVSVGAAMDLATGSEDGSGADYANVEDFELVIPAGESGVAMEEGFVLSVTDDDLAEGFETVTVSGSTVAPGIGTVTAAVITIVDDDGAVALTVDSDPGEGVSTRVEEGVAAQVEVSAELPAGVTAERDLTVSVSVGAEGDGGGGGRFCGSG